MIPERPGRMIRRLTLGSAELVPPSERGRVTVGESHVMKVVVVGAGPEGYPVPQAPREIVSGVSVDGLEQPENDPDVDGDDVEVGSEETVEERSTDGTGTEDEDLEGVSVFSSQTERCAVLVVHLVDVLVEGTVVECSVGKVVPGVLEDEEEGDLGDDGGPGWEGNGMGSETKVFSHRVEAPDLMVEG